MMLITQETLNKKIKELMQIHEKTLAALMDRIDSGIVKNQISKNGIKYIEATPLRMDIKRLRVEVLTEIQKYTKD